MSHHVGVRWVLKFWKRQIAGRVSL